MKYIKLFEANEIIDKVKNVLSKETIKQDIREFIADNEDNSKIEGLLFHLSSAGNDNDNLSDRFNAVVNDSRRKFYLIGGKYIDYFMLGFQEIEEELKEFENSYLRPLVYDCFAEVIVELIEEDPDNVNRYIESVKKYRIPKKITENPLLIQYKRGLSSGLWNTKIQN